ncbi:putative quinol monooxygenase [Ilumatobacter sp.]|uniref:putative quinol monooxygenase n=1 Tax=Ilumatobacter sp. TaxID=1967498 RepID=UPI003B524FC1
MSKVSVIAKITANEGQRSDMIAAMGTMMEHVEANEPDTLKYILMEDGQDDDVVWMYEEYTDDEAFQAHGTSDTMKELGAALRPYAAGRPQVIVCNPVRGKGL